MLETCKSCGTVFEVDESIVTDNIQWFKCGVCNNKWILTSNLKKKSTQKKIVIKDKSEKVKQELASIKSVVEDKSKILAKKPNPVLDQKNKSVADIASELSLSKLNQTKNKTKQSPKENYKKKSKELNILPILLICMSLLICFALLYRSTIMSYGFLYFPTYSAFYAKKINDILIRFEIPIYADINSIDLVDFVATIQDQEINFAGVIKNTSQRPTLVPRIKVLAIREDRKIILEKVLILKDKIILANSKISFNKLVKAKLKNNRENVTVKATLLKKVFDY